jgi:peptidoglycan hydrolase-like protein with peptidoglycan-binding domain
VRNGARMGGRAATVEADGFDDRGPRLLGRLAWSHRDLVGFVVAAFATITILVNILFLQAGPHPAPMVKSAVAGPVAVTSAPTGIVLASVGAPTTIPRQRPSVAESAPVEPPATLRPQAAVVTDIQRELARRGFYEGGIDGRYGPRTDTAIRDFEQAAGLKPSVRPDEMLLRAIVQSQVNAKQPNRRVQPTPPLRIDPIAEMLTPSKRVVAVQRALTEFGYGQIEPTGLVDPETQVAIEKFERQRKLPITGQVSDRLARELAALTGRPIE